MVELRREGSLECPEAMEEVFDLLDGEISPELEAKIRASLKSCDRSFPERDLDAAFLDLVRRQRGCDRARAEFKARLAAAIGRRHAQSQPSTTATDPSAAPAADFDEETLRVIDLGLLRLKERAESARGSLHQHEGCDAVVGQVLRLRDEARDLALEVVRAQLESCVERALRAGETTSAVQSLRSTLDRFLR